MFVDLRENEQEWLDLFPDSEIEEVVKLLYKSLMYVYIIEGRRKYHNINHILHCFNELKGSQHLARNLKATKLALWFHDIVYEPGAEDNEERSIDIFVRYADALSISESLKHEVRGLILATKHFFSANTEDVTQYTDASLVIDIDLSILGQPSDKFNEYEAQIREEYQHVPDEIFYPKRREILKSFLTHLPIYSTKPFFDKYEAYARQNIANSINLIDSLSYTIVDAGVAPIGAGNEEGKS